MLNKLRNWRDSRYRPLSDKHFLTKSIRETAAYTRIDNDPEFRDRFPQRLGSFRLGACFAKVIDPGCGLFVTLRLYYHGDPYRTECLYKFEWAFGNEHCWDELFNVKYGSEIFGCDPEHVNEEFATMWSSITATIALNRYKMHADLTIPVEPSTLSDDELAKRRANWEENWSLR